jgi:anti-sigma regulatory factor (Ser/Thr protein kinase)
MHLRAEEASPRLAREFVTDTMRQCRVAPETIDVARLLTSELVTNAVVHAHSPTELAVRVTPARVRVEVTDHDASFAERRDARDTDRHGRGLTIVSRLSREWGVEPRTDGKTVWFELGATRA